MDDRDRARELLLYREGLPVGTWTDVLADVAVKARELFGPSPEMLAVVEAAEGWEVGQPRHDGEGSGMLAGACDHCRLIRAVDSYRASIDTKPRYRVAGSGDATLLYDSTKAGWTIKFGKWDDGFPQRVADLLNAAEAAGK